MIAESVSLRFTREENELLCQLLNVEEPGVPYGAPMSQYDAREALLSLMDAGFLIDTGAELCVDEVVAALYMYREQAQRSFWAASGKGDVTLLISLTDKLTILSEYRGPSVTITPVRALTAELITDAFVRSEGPYHAVVRGAGGVDMPGYDTLDELTRACMSFAGNK